ncbi:MAG: hypothetical protein J6U06_02925 [Spirochaetaceae bacterium]|nr:hypothetical protein [Spirochaetaceae bacterium]
MADTTEKVTEKVVTPEESVNALRIKYLKADLVWKIVSLLVFIATGAYVVLVFKKVINLNLWGNSVVVLILLVAIFVCVYMLPHFLKMGSKHKAYSSKYKEAFLKPTLEEAFSKGEYNETEKISTRDLTRNSMIKKAKSAVANDCISGVYKKIPFLRYDLALRYGKKKAGSDCVMIVAQYKSHLKSEVQIIGNDFKIGGMDYEQPESFCKKHYLDERVMAEILNIITQLEQIVSDLGIPVLSGGSMEDYLTCVATGMIQFVCVRERRENYKSLTAEHIQIHPGSNMFRSEPQFIVAGEIVRTSRMFAMSVSPLSRNILQRIDSDLERALLGKSAFGKKEKPVSSKKKERTAGQNSSKSEKNKKAPADENILSLCDEQFEIEKIKGKKRVILPLKKLLAVLPKLAGADSSYLSQIGPMKSVVLVYKGKSNYKVLAGERLDRVLKVAGIIELVPSDNKWPKKLSYHIAQQPDELIKALDFVFKVFVSKEKSRELGFVCLFTDGNGTYWFKICTNFSTALSESLSSLETLIDDSAENMSLSNGQKDKLNSIYRKLHTLYDD